MVLTSVSDLDPALQLLDLGLLAQHLPLGGLRDGGGRETGGRRR